MNHQAISLQPLLDKTVAILGYGNQGRAHGQNLRDSGVKVIVGARPGGKAEAAGKEDKLPTFGLREAAEKADIVMLLLPDEVIPSVYRDLLPVLKGKTIGFAHGFAYTFGLLEISPQCSYFLVGPKGAGAILRQQFLAGPGLPGVFAVAPHSVSVPETKAIATAYAKGIGCANQLLLETNFREETECDLFGEQSVLCGGIMELMGAAFQTLTERGHSPEMAFFECCFEARMILELWMKYGPSVMSERISPTAFYGGLTRGRRLITDETRKEMGKIFDEIRSGAFAKEWMAEVANGRPHLKAERDRLRASALQKAYDRLVPQLAESKKS